VRENIYTIPLQDALNESECPFCYLLARTEKDLLRLYVEGGLMEPDWRGLLLEHGLCGRHLQMLYKDSSRLATAILVKGLLDHEEERLSQSRPKPPVGSCLACQDLERAFQHYAAGFLMTMAKEPEFRGRVRNSGLCITHLWELLRYKSFKFKRLDPALERELIDASRERMGTIRKDLEWFIKKFDYRFENEPWKGAEDALERAIRLMGGDNLV
jgi:hypothetical protein